MIARYVVRGPRCAFYVLSVGDTAISAKVYDDGDVAVVIHALSTSTEPDQYRCSFLGERQCDTAYFDIDSHEKEKAAARAVSTGDWGPLCALLLETVAPVQSRTEAADALETR